MIGNKISVFNTYTINDDVSNATGNINFLGSLIIYGNILTGFSVQASGNITVNGSAEDANIIAGGNIVLTEGIHGGGEDSQSVIQAGGSIISKYIQSVNVIAGGDIEATYIQHSVVQSGGNIILSGSKGKLTGGRAMARNSITAAFVGGRNGRIPTMLEVGNNPATAEHLRNLNHQLETTDTQMNSLKPAINMLSGLEQEGKLSDDRKGVLVEARAAYTAMEENMISLQEEKRQIEQEMASLGYGIINVKQAAYPGVKIVIGSESMALDKEFNCTTFTRNNEGITFGPYRG
jgi:uncharacterized protein (DUF342 family)